MTTKYNKSDFKHKYTGEVQFSEVDSFNVAHNIIYLYWLEWARTQYLFDIGVNRANDFFPKILPILVAHSEIDYYNSIYFSNQYTVLTKVLQIGDSSIKFINQVYCEDKLIAEASAVMVNVNPITKEPERIPDYLRDLVNKYEN